MNGKLKMLETGLTVVVSQNIRAILNRITSQEEIFLS